MQTDCNISSFESRLDEKDWIILKMVQDNARISFAELGRRARLSPPAAAERLRRLEDLKIIRGYHARVSHEHLGLGMTALIEIQVKRSDYSRFQKAVEKLGSVLECHHISGRVSFLLKTAVPSVSGLEALIGSLSQYGETFTSIVLSTIVERRVFRCEPQEK
jgi:Lrp/AsnC family leucine-responsive transcriptional regulator